VKILEFVLDTVVASLNNDE